MKIAVIDNYDSFVYNLVHYIQNATQEVVLKVFRNDQFEIEELNEFDKILLSPGPGIPIEAGKLLEVIEQYASTKSILGVCLGHQAIGEFYGATLEQLDEVLHGVQLKVVNAFHNGVLQHLPLEFKVGHYHSWIIRQDSLPDCLEVTSLSEKGFITSIRHKEYDVQGVQFHPESILTEHGQQIINQWILS